MTYRAKHLRASILLVSALVCVTGPLRAEDSASRAEDSATRAEARAHFQKGLECARDGRYAEAVAAFETAYATSPNYVVLYNLGQAYAVLGRSVEAVHTFERFLTEGGYTIEPGRPHAFEALTERERAHLGRLELHVSPAGSELFIDGKRLGAGPFAPEDVTAGEHVVVARSPGYLSLVRTVDVAAGQTLTLDIELEIVPSSVTSPVVGAPVARPAVCPPPPAVARPDSRRKWALGVGSVGVALAGAALATYVWNNHRYAVWQEQRAAFDGAAANGDGGSNLGARGDALADRAANVQRVDDLALGFAVAAGAALVTAGILWFTAPPSEHHRAAAAASR